ncbi:helix-turn-helix domain-containing protein [Rhodococcus hoagii]|uniref:Helix-turn-helix domain-containing protein n=1 Tax=Rhodococcus hoagii TaxID=43767 RepID=A0AAE2W888_RHOHA|nr:helix-turn-helix domain-containing protein [Prescottella equi]MBM4542416.1 helix-turn-helix domain-containing protein [Prescottella equi]MBM4715839.1 helix-turn-helix domain-containing protein [Prescottella equi]NKS14020.1 helix-turn-helix domain-containing protein [Prescottella equi]
MTTRHSSGAVQLDRLPAREAAEYLGLTTKSLANQRSAGKGPAWYKIGGRVWYDLRDLDMYVARCKAETLVGA